MVVEDGVKKYSIEGARLQR